MKLKDLIDNKEFSENNINILGLSEDSREIKKNYIFFLKKTKKEDEKKHVLEAIDKGAKLIIYSKKKLIKITNYNSDCIFYNVPNLDKCMSKLSKVFYKLPKKDIKIYGVTGTNGKSTIINLIAQFLELKNNKCGLIGTMGSGIHPRMTNKGLTTPNIININKNIKKFTDKRVNTIAMEISSHGIDQNRIKGLSFEAVIFTNLTHDHLDFHKNMNNYFNVKLKLFTEYKNKKKVIFIDNYYGNKIYSILKNENNNKIKTVSLNNINADYYSSNIEYTKNGINFIVNSKYGIKKVSTKLYGEFSVTNILITIATLVNNKKEYNFFIDNMMYLKPLDGRMQKLKKKNNPTVFIDFAHTPDAVKKVLLSVKKHFPDHEITTIFGCGGDRDKSKRKIMGEIIDKYSNNIIVTNDNPRNEDQNVIANNIISGIKESSNFSIILDRRKAIKNSLNKKFLNNIIMILGKGHETHQIINNKSITLNDKDEVLKAFKSQ